MALWYVYVLRCRDGSLYTGIATDVARRVATHNAGRGARYTRARRPVEVIYTERKRTQGNALRREAAIKALSRADKLTLITTPVVRTRAKRPRRENLLASAALAFLVTATAAHAEETTRVLVPAGSFTRGSNQHEDDERPARQESLPAFAIDQTETTRGAYDRCVAAHACKAPPPAFRSTAGADRERLPVVGVSWFDARDYCRFAGGRLPSESEWEKAARGPDGRRTPWGQEGADVGTGLEAPKTGDNACARANWGNENGEGLCAGVNPGHPVAVGTYPAGASVYGVLDLGGNVWEWTADAYEDEPGRRVVKGGSCCDAWIAPRASNRNAWEPHHRDPDLGFRCVSNPSAPRPGKT